MSRVSIALLFLFTSVVVQPASAEIAFSVSPSSSAIDQGSTGTIAFGVTAMGSDTSQTIDAYRIGFTPTAFGGADLADITFSSPTPIAASNLSNGFTANSGGGGTDPGSFFVFSSLDSGVGPQVLGSELLFFEIGYSIDGGATELGGFNIDITNIASGNPAADVLISLSGATIPASSTGIEGTLAFTAIPEPGSAIILVSTSMLLVLRRRRN